MNDLREELLEFAVDLLSRRLQDGKVARALASCFPKGEHDRDMILAIIEEAKKRLDASEDPEETKKKSIAFYLSVIRDDSVKMSDRIAAQARVDALMGVDKQVTVGGPEDVAARIRETLEAQEKAYG